MVVKPLSGLHRRGSNIPSNNPELLQAVPDLLEVLRDPVFDHLGAGRPSPRCA
jgi:hypothetical protein